jgi:FkbM family methyltransferase
VFDILQILPPPPPVIRILDIGAMIWGTEPYEKLRAAGLARVIGFEPQPAECAKLNETHGPSGHTYLPYVVGDGSARTFYLTRHPPSSSVYEPDIELAGKFQTLGDLYQVARTEPVQTHRLDDHAEQIGEVDLVKIDTQGAELDIIRGGQQTLRQALVIHTEVEFVPLYKSQPLFSDIDPAARAMGFSFLKFYSTAGRPFVPLVMNGDPTKRISQMLWGDAVYVRNFMALDALPPERLIKLAVIAHTVYDAYDLAHLALSHHDRARGGGGGGGGDLAGAYLRALSQS